jgi:formylglycine-generating enzyme required for sulfatase activity
VVPAFIATGLLAGVPLLGVAAVTEVVAWLGSTAQEMDAALALCRSYGSHCQRESYTTETHRRVALSPFEIDRYEVTNELFARFVRATDYRTLAERQGHSYTAIGDVAMEARGHSWRMPTGPGSIYTSIPNHPVAHIAAPDAETYCAHAGGRLPSEDEWEFAARGRQRRIYPWGNEWDPARLNWKGTDANGTRPVGSFRSGTTPGGVHDLAGNVWEWTSTTIAGDRILKGGSAAESNPANLRAAVQLGSRPAVPRSDSGFRCARDLETWPRARSRTASAAR